MRTTGVILIAWPGSYALTQLYWTADFFWLSLGLGCPLLAWSLFRASADMLTLESGDVWHSHTVYPETDRQLKANAKTLREKFIESLEADVEIVDVPYDLPKKDVA
jgi:hypothetical protein